MGTNRNPGERLALRQVLNCVTIRFPHCEREEFSFAREQDQDLRRRQDHDDDATMFDVCAVCESEIERERVLLSCNFRRNHENGLFAHVCVRVCVCVTVRIRTKRREINVKGKVR